MREILFRGKDGSGVWHYGFPMYGESSPIQIQSNAPESDGFYVHDVLRETLSQFTGLTDKNGKKIFEGDIVKTHYANAPKADFVEQVVFHCGKFCAEGSMWSKGKCWAPLADGIKHIPQDKLVYMESCEIIGNISDNPKLLEAES